MVEHMDVVTARESGAGVSADDKECSGAAEPVADAEMAEAEEVSAGASPGGDGFVANAVAPGASLSVDGAPRAGAPLAKIVSAVSTDEDEAQGPVGGVVSTAPGHARDGIFDAGAHDGSAAQELSPGERCVSLIMRAIFRVSPAVLDCSNKVATPALLLAYFTCRMAFLCEAAGDGGRDGGAAHDSEEVAATLLSMFDDPVEGWRKMCGMFGLCDRGLFLSGRVSASSHFVGQPDTVPKGLGQSINPHGKHQWISRRLSLRSRLALLPVPDSDGAPGALTADELSDLRRFLSSVSGKRAAASAGIFLLPGRGADKDADVLAAMEFNWSHEFSPSSTPGKLVEELKIKFLKAPSCDLARVSAFPVVTRLNRRTRAAKTAAVVESDEAANATDINPFPVDSASIGVARQTGKRPAVGSVRPSRQRRPGSGRFRGSAPESPIPSTPALVAVAEAVVTGRVHPCTAWPLGAWALQVTLCTDLDLSAAGCTRLRVGLVPRSVEPGENGDYDYTLVVTQRETNETQYTNETAGSVCVAPGLDQRSRSVDFLEGVRRVAQKRSSVRRSSTAGESTMEPSSQSAGGLGHDPDRDSSSLRVTVMEAPAPPDVPWAFEHVFASPMLLEGKNITCVRIPGRLWVVVGAAAREELVGVDV